MHIVEVCIRFGAPGGVETHVAAISRELAKLGHDLTIVTSDLVSEKPFVRSDSFPPAPDGVNVVRLRARPRGATVFQRLQLEGLGDALSKIDADIYHGHSHRYHHLEAMAKSARRAARPWVVTPHYHPIEASEPQWKRLGARVYDARTARLVYRDAARVFLVTDAERKFLEGIVEPKKMRTIPNGIDLAEWTHQKSSRNERRFVMFAGRLATNKGLVGLVDAWAIVAPKHPDVNLVLVGSEAGAGAAIRERVKHHGLVTRVEFAGHLPREEYRAALASAAAFVLPSEWEAFGIVLLEAMAAGTPVVAMNVGGIPDVCANEENALLVEPGSPSALAHALTRVLDDDALVARLTRAGHENAARYDWATIGQALDRELRDAARSRE